MGFTLYYYYYAIFKIFLDLTVPAPVYVTERKQDVGNSAKGLDFKFVH